MLVGPRPDHLSRKETDGWNHPLAHAVTIPERGKEAHSFLHDPGSSVADVRQYDEFLRKLLPVSRNKILL
jgi:hypothetical protein